MSEIWNSVLDGFPAGTIGIALGFVATRLIDLFSKRYEFKLESKRIFYTEKIECGAKAVQSLESMNGYIYNLVTLITQLLENESFSQTLFDKNWEESQSNISNIGESVSSAYNKASFYYQLDDKTGMEELLMDVHSSASEVVLMIESKKSEGAKEILSNYGNVMRRLGERNDKLISEIKKQSKP